ncbi:MAG: hypothetical protein GY830_08630 [Bacteroidetes bacterium]|nr:hypothetical protein [Bacteroidota bacterium]
MKKFAIIFLIILNISLLYANTNKNILAIYNSTNSKTFSRRNNPISMNIEFPLNHLGYRLIYHDLQKGLPLESDLEKADIIISWLSNKVLNAPEEYCYWLKEVVKKGKKLILFENLHPYINAKTQKSINFNIYATIFNIIGLDIKYEYTINPFILNMVYKDSKIFDFEKSFDNALLPFIPISLNEKNQEKSKVYLKMHNRLTNKTSTPIVKTEKGILIVPKYAISTYKGIRQWYLNPFDFFKDILNIEENTPIFDTTTLFGNRVLYTHIDGDGVRNISLIDTKKYSGELLYSNILTKYQEFLTTVSFIITDIHPDFFGSKRSKKLFNKILSLNNVELGNHSFSHPLHWVDKLTAVEIPGYSKSNDLNPRELKIIRESHYNYLTYLAYIFVSDDDFYAKEITESTYILNKMAKNLAKQTMIFQWSGNCLPNKDALKVIYDNKLRNINGGDSRFDISQPSYTGLSPLYVSLDGYIQVLTSNINENGYTNNWIGSFFGFKYLIETFKQTEYSAIINKPIFRRVSPMNIYYHFYIAERSLALNSLHEIYEYVSKLKTIPIYTSQYYDLIIGFINSNIKKLKENEYLLTNYGKCTTIRLEGTSYYPDFKKSKGVLGFKQWKDYTYIHLIENGPTKLSLSKSKPQNIYLKESNVILENYIIEKKQISFSFYNFKEAKIIFGNIPKKDIKVQIEEKEKKKIIIIGKENIINNELRLFIDDFKNNIKVSIYV